MSTSFTCVTCGVQYSRSGNPLPCSAKHLWLQPSPDFGRGPRTNCCLPCRRTHGHNKLCNSSASQPSQPCTPVRKKSKLPSDLSRVEQFWQVASATPIPPAVGVSPAHAPTADSPPPLENSQQLESECCVCHLMLTDCTRRRLDATSALAFGVHSHLQVPISGDEVTCNACYILVSSLHIVAVQYDKLAVELRTRHKSGKPRPGHPMNIGTLRSLTFVGNEGLLGEVISFLDPRALASCRHFESAIRKFASAALQVRKCITQGC